MPPLSYILHFAQSFDHVMLTSRDFHTAFVQEAGHMLKVREIN